MDCGCHGLGEQATGAAAEGSGVSFCGAESVLELGGLGHTTLRMY